MSSRANRRAHHDPEASAPPPEEQAHEPSEVTYAEYFHLARPRSVRYRTRVKQSFERHSVRPDGTNPKTRARVAPSPVATREGSIERRRALQVSAYQCGILITAESSRRWPVGLWPAKIGAPRRNRTYNPLAGSRVISWSLPTASLLVTASTRWCGSRPMMAAA